MIIDDDLSSDMAEDDRSGAAVWNRSRLQNQPAKIGL